MADIPDQSVDRPLRKSKLGTKHLKSALKRALARTQGSGRYFGGHVLDKAADRILLDAAGETQVERAVVVGRQIEKYRVEIDPQDRHRAFALIRDSLDGKPLQEVVVDAGAITNVVVLRAKVGEEPEMPESVKEILRLKEADGGMGESDDFDDSEG
jgi:hypothetical protein